MFSEGVKKEHWPEIDWIKFHWKLSYHQRFSTLMTTGSKTFKKQLICNCINVKYIHSLKRR